MTTPEDAVRCTGISDEDLESRARIELAKITSRVQATKNKAIVWIAPFRKDGVIEMPWDYRPNSCEAVMVSDGTGMGIPKGTVVMVHPEEGIYHDVDGVRLCFINRNALMLAKAA